MLKKVRLTVYFNEKSKVRYRWGFFCIENIGIYSTAKSNTRYGWGFIPLKMVKSGRAGDLLR